MNCQRQHPTRIGARLPWRRVALPIALALVTVAAAADTPSGGPYLLRKQVVAAGGMRSSGGTDQLVATIAQPAVGPVTGGDYVLQQGFHAAAGAAPDPNLFQDSFESD